MLRPWRGGLRGETRTMRHAAVLHLAWPPWENNDESGGRARAAAGTLGPTAHGHDQGAPRDDERFQENVVRDIGQASVTDESGPREAHARPVSDVDACGTAAWRLTTAKPHPSIVHEQPT